MRGTSDEPKWLFLVGLERHMSAYFRTCHSTPVSTRLTDLLMEGLIDALVSVCTLVESDARVPSYVSRGVSLSGVLYVMWCFRPSLARCNLPLVQVFARFPFNKPSNLFSFFFILP